MENKAYDELMKLCQEIIDSDSDTPPDELLENSRKLYDKLVIWNYNQKDSAPEPKEEETPVVEMPKTVQPKIVEPTQKEPEIHTLKSVSLNDSLNKGKFSLGLNDRIAFQKHLFNGLQEDLNRVISQLNTFGSYQEAETFIEQVVAPDYNWPQDDDYRERFLDLVKLHFGEPTE